MMEQGGGGAGPQEDVAAPGGGPADHLGEDAAALYSKIPEDGTAASDQSVRVALGWESEETGDRYFSTRDLLEDAGLVVRGRGVEEPSVAFWTRLQPLMSNPRPRPKLRMRSPTCFAASMIYTSPCTG